MTRYDRRLRVFAMCLSALAGFVDATGFVLSSGFFVSFMSGNSTRLAVGLAEGSGAILVAGGLIASFVVGVVAGSLVASSRGERRKPAVVAFATLALVVAAALESAGLTGASLAVLALAMGVLNNVFLRNGEVSIGVTYMTGTLVRLGQRIAASLRGEAGTEWLPYLMLWMSLVAGASVGALLAVRGPSWCLWVAAGFGMILTAGARLVGTKPVAGA